MCCRRKIQRFMVVTVAVRLGSLCCCVVVVGAPRFLLVVVVGLLRGTYGQHTDGVDCLPIRISVGHSCYYVRSQTRCAIVGVVG